LGNSYLNGISIPPKIVKTNFAEAL
jgi:hypothetical protein